MLWKDTCIDDIDSDTLARSRSIVVVGHVVGRELLLLGGDREPYHQESEGCLLWAGIEREFGACRCFGTCDLPQEAPLWTAVVCMR